MLDTEEQTLVSPFAAMRDIAEETASDTASSASAAMAPWGEQAQLAIDDLDKQLAGLDKAASDIAGSNLSEQEKQELLGAIDQIAGAVVARELGKIAASIDPEQRVQAMGQLNEKYAKYQQSGGGQDQTVDAAVSAAVDQLQAIKQQHPELDTATLERLLSDLGNQQQARGIDARAPTSPAALGQAQALISEDNAIIAHKEQERFTGPAWKFGVPIAELKGGHELALAISGFSASNSEMLEQYKEKGKPMPQGMDLYQQSAYPQFDTLASKLGYHNTPNVGIASSGPTIAKSGNALL